MKKYTGLIACLAVLLAFQAPSEAKPEGKGPNHGPKPPAHSHHMKKPPHHHSPHMRIHYNYSRPCHAHHMYDCYDCYHRSHGHHRGIFGNGIGFTIFL